MCLQNFGSTFRYQGHPQVKVVINPTPELGQFLPEEGKIQHCGVLAYFGKVTSRRRELQRNYKYFEKGGGCKIPQCDSW